MCEGGINDGYTYISTLGKSVVDYIITSHDCLTKCKSFNVFTMNFLNEKCNTTQMLSTRCKLPDHSILLVELEILGVVQRDVENSTNMTSNRKYNFNRVDEKFLNNDDWNVTASNLIEQVIRLDQSQDAVNEVYAEFCNSVNNEMDKYICHAERNSNMKRPKHPKPFWNEKLYVLWKEANAAGKEYSKYVGLREVKECLRQEYQRKQKLFDKEIRKAEKPTIIRKSGI